MVGKNNSTILTVSYGTFSCTLEGFDDSFGMMKAIAEYFRDLAADDRFFGAEPPTPDADMLAKIAEKEVSRRVEARSENGGVVLRPYEIEDAQTAADEIETIQPEQPEEPAPAPVARTAPAPTAFVDESDAFFGDDTHGAMLDEESVAVRLQRIREAARANVSQAEAEDDHVDPVTDQEEDQTDPALDQLDEVEVPQDEPETLEDASDNLTDDVSEEDLADLLAMDGIDEAPTEESQPEPSIETDEELQALLGRIDDPEDEIEEEATSPEPFEFTPDAEDQGFEDEEAEDTAEPIQARILHVKGAALQDMENITEDDLIGYDDDAYEVPENEVDADTLDAIFDETDEPGTPSSLSPEDEADLMRELAEVEADETDEDDEDGDWGDLLDADTEAVVSDEEHLFSGDPEEALASAQDLSSLLTDREADDEVGRLMEETETQLSEPSHTRRKTTIQHLKAAFASRKADGAQGIEDKTGNDSAAYKEDLDSAVKPRRPVLGGPRKTERLAASEAAPLKLVAAQKIVPDDLQSEPSSRPTLVKPVRPRRVRGGNAAVAEDYETDAIAVDVAPKPKPDFADFAVQMGVEKLPELLEAAASYMTFVQEFEKFSRPQVMTLVREVMGQDYTREDGLRAFGQLLREGKLIRLEGGRFTVSDGIGFQPA